MKHILFTNIIPIVFDCIMNGSGHLEEDYRQSIHVCPVDLRKFQHLVGFDILHRYRALLKFYESYHMEENASWTRDMIQHLTKRSLPDETIVQISDSNSIFNTENSSKPSSPIRRATSTNKKRR